MISKTYSGNQKEGKQAYSPPRIEEIDLFADEVLAAGCKNDFTSGANSPTCIVTPCAGVGS